MTNRPSIFAALSNPDRPLISETIPSLSALIRRRALTAEKAQGVYEHLWLAQSAAWTEDEQRDFALGHFMATYENERAAACPPSVAAFTPNRGDHLPTARRRLAYKAGMAFAQGKGSDEAFGIIRGTPFCFGMKPKDAMCRASSGQTMPRDLVAIQRAAERVADSVAAARGKPDRGLTVPTK